MPSLIFSNAELATFVVSELGGASRPIDTEDVAIALFQLAPDRFAWKKYPENIDIHVVRIALSDAQRKKPALLAGGIKDGWMLTPDGLVWSTKPLTQEMFNKSELNKLRIGSYADLVDIERNRLLKTTAHRIALKDPDKITLTEFHRFLRINEYFPKNKIQNRLLIVRNAIKGNPELQSTWEVLSRKFERELSEYDQ